MSGAGATPVDLLDPTVHARQDITDYWRRLRRENPVHWQPVDPTSGAVVKGFWVVTRHADIVRVVRDTRTFTSLHGNMLGTLLKGGDSASGKMLVVTEGSRHTALRRLLTSGFGPQALGPVREAIATATRELLASLVVRGGGEFVAEVAAQIPLRAICGLLGVPEADQQQVLELTNAAMLGEQGAEENLEVQIAQSEILLYYTQLAAERRTAPGDDIISLLVASEVDGRLLTEEEVLLNCYNLIIGGDETARLAMAGGLQALAEHPEQWARLRAQEALVAPATEEVLRWTTPVAHVARRATMDTVLDGHAVAAGDVVTLWPVSANRDEEVFADPDVFDLGRDPNRHLTFGYGRHFCLGGQLARVEIQALLSQLHRTVAAVEITGAVPRLASTFVHGVKELPVALTPA